MKDTIRMTRWTNSLYRYGTREIEINVKGVAGARLLVSSDGRSCRRTENLCTGAGACVVQID